MSDEKEQSLVSITMTPPEPQPPPFSPSGLRAGIVSIDENIAQLRAAIKVQEQRRTEYEEYIAAHEVYAEEMLKRVRG